jgi:hypothetical protein
MTLSESVLASFAPPLQLMLNPQAKVLAGESPGGQSDVVQRAEAEGGGEAIAAEVPAAPAPDANSDSRTDE